MTFFNPITPEPAKTGQPETRWMQILSSMINKALKHGNSEKQFLLKKCEM